MITFDIARSEEDLKQILQLQKLNLKTEISDQTKKEQGFLTVNHKFEELVLMYESSAQIVARQGGKVVGFALAMLPDLGKLVSDLKPLFVLLDGLSWKSTSIKNYNYYVMGQICVDTNFRGQGVFDGLYQKHKEVYSPDFELCITEISTSNTRSQRAHERVGFETIHLHVDHVDEWNVVVWEF